MNEYQINVAANGRFLFRTEWDDDKERVTNAAVMLKSSMPLAEVTIYTRDKSMTRIEVK